ncbi:MAG: TerB family tellurite resistance protein [Acidobacteria bacterium]|nr:MAG: TerB family tellurite resistance protein [Acidobacteriota bacterium]
MIRTIQEFFQQRIISEKKPVVSLEHALHLATTALLIEISRADFEVADEERVAIQEALTRSFGLTEDETREIIALAEHEVDASVSVYEFTHLVDESFTREQKKHIIGLLWQIAYSDDRLEEHEEHLIRKIAKLLHIDHRDFIAEKLKAKDAKAKA